MWIIFKAFWPLAFNIGLQIAMALVLARKLSLFIVWGVIDIVLFGFGIYSYQAWQDIERMRREIELNNLRLKYRDN